VRFLRHEDEPDQLGPQPGLRQLQALLDGVPDADVEVRLSVVGVPDQLPASLDVSAYRIVQEALTNVLKHSTARHVRIEVRGEPCRLSVAVVDDGHERADGRAEPGGQGLIGMRERTALHHGELTAGPLPGGGFGVLARFPLDGAAR
jgi:signal transduction histidine kinase